MENCPWPSSHRYWQRRFASDPGVVGRKFRLNNTIFTICGVTTPEFFGVTAGQAPEITFPLGMDGVVRGGESWLDKRNYNFLSLMARLRPGAGIKQSQAEAAAVFAPVMEEDAARRSDEFTKKQIREQRIELQPAGTGFDHLRRQFSEPLFFLMGIVGLVLLLACANIANLLLVRAVARQAEISVRLAIGAGRGRVVRQLLAEGLLLAGLGGSAGILLAYWFSDALVAMMSNGGPRMAIDVHPDLRVLAFATAVTLASCFAFALAPALRVTRASVHPAIKQAGSAGRHRLGKSLVVLQVCISTVLVVGAGLFLRTLLNLRQLDTGFERQDRVVFTLNIKKSEFRDERLRELVAAVHQRLQSVPGVASASFSLFPPISGGQVTGDPIVEGYEYRQGENRDIHLNEAGAGLFRTLGTPILLGREFTDRDALHAPKVAIVNQAFARYYYAGASPIGKRLRWDNETGTIEIIGMVKNVHYESLRQAPPPTIYFPASQSKELQNWYTWIVRFHGDSAVLKGSLEKFLRTVHPSLRPLGLKTLTDHVDRTILRERLLAVLSGFFGALALALACLGIYGVLAFRVAARKSELGVRMALGARPGQILWFVFREAAALVFAGLAIGLGIAIAASKLTTSMLFGLQPSDPASLAFAAMTLLAAAAAAAYVPGRRATRLDPAQVMRYE
ncbi:MAG: ADOP family duplicated permease [Bryobacteraceae bacterium]